MLSFFLTVDVEIWCDGWSDLDAKFPLSFDRYVYGPTDRGHQGLPEQLRLLAEHGLKAVFFVEPLFATRFGMQPLHDIVGLIREQGQEVQLHLHPEWVDESPAPLLGETGPRYKRQFMHQYSRQEQATLISLGACMLQQAGVPRVSAFRAGGFGFNADTLGALEDVGIPMDFSYNETMFGPKSGVAPGNTLHDTAHVGGVLEVPMTCFTDGGGRRRHLQLGACSFAEFESCISQAQAQRRRTLVALSHNFELMNPGKTDGDRIVRRRMRALCAHLESQSAGVRTVHVEDFDQAHGVQPEQVLRASLGSTSWRWLEQAARRVLA